MTGGQAAGGTAVPLAAPCIGGDGAEQMGGRYLDPEGRVYRIVVYLAPRMKVYRLVDADDMPPANGLAYYEVVCLHANGDASVLPVVASTWGRCAHQGSACREPCWCECRSCTDWSRWSHD